MNWQFYWTLLALMQMFLLSESSHVPLAKEQHQQQQQPLQLLQQELQTEVNASIGHLPTHPAVSQQANLQSANPNRRHFEQHRRPHQENVHHGHNGQRVHRLHSYENRRHYHLHSSPHHRHHHSHRRPQPHHSWVSRRPPHQHQGHNHFGRWSPWSSCSPDCMRRRERYCKVKRKCGHTKHIEERKCRRCHPVTDDSKWSTSTTSNSLAPHGAHTPQQPQQQQQQQQQQQISSNTAPTIIINAAAAAASAPIATATSVPTASPHTQPTLIVGTPTELNKHHPVIQSDELIAQHVTAGSYADDDDDDDESDFYVIKAKRKRPPQPRPSIVSYPDIPVHHDIHEDFYSDEQAEDALNELGSAQPPFEYLESSSNQIRTILRPNRYNAQRQHHGPAHRHQHQRHNNGGQRKLKGANGGGGTFDESLEGDVFQYEDFDIDLSHGDNQENGDVSYEDFADYADYRNGSIPIPPSKERATPEHLIPKHRRIYSKWSRWTKCTPKCTTRRYKKCRVREQCGREVLREIAYCYTEGSFCQQWLQAQVQKSPAYELRPAATRRRDVSDDGTLSNSIVSDFIMNGKGYRGPEYTPMKLKCGIAPIRSNKRNMYNMLKIIGGKAARKGEWPWQVAIFNRFKEAFCGGTLIAPQWILTAAHCVRKVLYVRLGEHNLDHEDGTELHLKVLKSFKHPSFDKKTVDSDVALLKLPKPVNTTTWIGFSCLPKPYQPLPKNMECTVIGWGKRRNRDVAGTSVLHQAEVPIISMDNCRSVYYDYTITKNMFCAGHKRGRIDTCAGDSGGPLLCRDTTKPNHPWTIFGITSFGDGCAKRNKFGIYAKVPNYVDWVWSVINCNGNCKMHQRL
ncbi:uncharacterized protein LOC106094434 [Stomoxys calcitrans]|uniref:uncharacterized protein LOC106094434 n=1 Tax=Stomoxys calcitrans TaxID=35570 RepID=UPI0027E2A071|nr:uncharacterized protein LOC106094434 [Stomoxys calcitrans]XP_059220922.1 uncharacterized protein LOC106094434 [Stomoxys calcitrans]